MKQALARTLVITICLAVVFGVMGSIYLAYRYSSEKVKYDDLLINYSYVDDNGTYKGKFSTSAKGKLLCDYDYNIDGTTLYITLYETTGEHSKLELDNDDYAKIEIPNCKSVKKVYYKNGISKDKMDFKKK